MNTDAKAPKGIVCRENLMALGDLRAGFPPLFNKLGAQVAAVGTAPAMVAALAVVGGAGGGRGATRV